MPPADGPGTADGPDRPPADGPADLAVMPDRPADLRPDASVDTAPLPARRLSLSADTYTPTYGDDNTAAARSENCPGDQVLVGFHVTHDGAAPVRGLVPVCGAVTVTAGATYALTIPSLTTRPALGGTGSRRDMLVCPSNQVVVGMFGRSSSLLDQLGLRCAPLVGASNGTVTHGSPVASLGPVPASATTPTFSYPFAAGMVARGYVINYGNSIDAIALSCARPALVP